MLVFCFLHVACLIEFNARPVGGSALLAQATGVSASEDLHKAAAAWCRALGCEQRWNMFSTVGARDGTRTLLKSPQHGELPRLAPGRDFFGAALREEERYWGWPVNFLNGRMRKLENNVIEGATGYSWARYNYVRWHLRRYLQGREQEAEEFLRVDLFRLHVRHPDPDGPPILHSVEHVMQYDERHDPAWPRHLRLTRVP
ncbi:MAG: hypothetical protein DCC64_10045 [Planctomycetota bacterium]|nr:MAG: hypothetical protein DCC64_10045 [Planctomycetota bacterium]